MKVQVPLSVFVLLASALADEELGQLDTVVCPDGDICEILEPEACDCMHGSCNIVDGSCLCQNGENFLWVYLSSNILVANNTKLNTKKTQHL